MPPFWRLEKNSPAHQIERDVFTYEASIAISLKRIADTLERIADAEKSK